MTLETIANKMASAIDTQRKSDKKSAPLLALLLYAIVTTKGDTVATLERLYLATFDRVPNVARKSVQSHFSRMKGFMAAMVDYGDHPDMMATIDAELALVDFVDGETVTKNGDTVATLECRQREGAKRFPKSPVFTKAADAIRRDEASGAEGEFTHEHAELAECDTVGEALQILDEAITKHAEIKSSLEQYRTKIVTDAIGAPTEFEIRGDANAAPSFSVKALN